MEDSALNFITIDLLVKRNVSYSTRTVQIRNGVFRYFKPNHENEVRFESPLSDIMIMDKDENANNTEILITSVSHSFPMIRITHQNQKILKTFKSNLLHLIEVEKSKGKKEQNESNSLYEISAITDKEITDIINEKKSVYSETISKTVKIISDKYQIEILDGKKILEENKKMFDNLLYEECSFNDGVMTLSTNVNKMMQINRGNYISSKLIHLDQLSRFIIEKKRNCDFFLSRSLLLAIFVLVVLYFIRMNYTAILLFFGLVLVNINKMKSIFSCIFTIGKEKEEVINIEGDDYYVKEISFLELNYIQILEFLISNLKWRFSLSGYWNKGNSFGIFCVPQKNQIYLVEKDKEQNIASAYALETNEVSDKTKISIFTLVKSEDSLSIKQNVMGKLDGICRMIKCKSIEDSLLNNQTDYYFLETDDEESTNDLEIKSD